jgi:hypothetical protein
LAGALLFDEKIHQSAVFFLFGLDCGMLEFFKYHTHEPSSKEYLLTFPHFWRLVEKIAVCAYTTHLPEK